MKIGIIIVTYNSEKDVKRLLNSIIIQKNENLVVYVVDNNSKDETINVIKRYQSELNICIIYSKKNTGFAGGNNIGIKKAIEDGCEYVFILNPDMQLDRRCIEILTERFQRDENIGVIGPIVLFPVHGVRECSNYENNIIQVYGVNANFRSQKKYPSYPNMKEKWSYELPTEQYCDFVLGGAMMIRCSILRKTGLFNEDFFMYNDELDIAYRINREGYKTLCMRDAIVLHHHDFNIKNKRGYNIMYYYILRNKFLYFKKYNLFTNLIFSLMFEIIDIPLKIIWSIRRMHNFGLLKFYYTGLLDGLLGKKGVSAKQFDKVADKKQFILTIDYELFLGEKTGDIKECMIEPTEKLASILEKNGSRMTVFWDILHYHRLLEIENGNSKLKQHRHLIEEQILDLTRNGHDIQLHVHPHWLDAKYENNNWYFNYDRFSLHHLSDEVNPNNINTITGCIAISKKLIVDLVRKVKPDHIVNTFRAGGYLIEPFDKIKNAFLENGIYFDSSVCPGLYNPNGISSYDFRFYPKINKYNFKSTPKIITNDGEFIEIPVRTIEVSWIRNNFYRLVKKIKYSKLEFERKGKGVGESYRVNEHIYEIQKKNNRLFSSQSTQLTTDSNFRQKFHYLYRKSPEYSTMILHPKLLNSHTLKLLDDYISSNKIRFISIQDFVNKK